MTARLTDLKQLTKAILKESPPSRVESAPVTMAKTPSDYRANLNNGNEIANKCF